MHVYVFDTVVDSELPGIAILSNCIYSSLDRNEPLGHRILYSLLTLKAKEKDYWRQIDLP